MKISFGTVTLVARFRQPGLLTAKALTDAARRSGYKVGKALLISDSGEQSESFAAQKGNVVVVYESNPSQIVWRQPEIPAFAEMQDLLRALLDESGLSDEDIAFYECNAQDARVQGLQPTALDAFKTLTSGSAGEVLKQQFNQDFQVGQIRLFAGANNHVGLKDTPDFTEVTLGVHAYNPKDLFVSWVVKRKQIRSLLDATANWEERLTEVVKRALGI